MPIIHFYEISCEVCGDMRNDDEQPAGFAAAVGMVLMVATIYFFFSYDIEIKKEVQMNAKKLQEVSRGK